MLKFWMIIRSYPSEQSWKVFRKCWTYLLSDIVLTTLFSHYGGLIWDQATMYTLHSRKSGQLHFFKGTFMRGKRTKKWDRMVECNPTKWINRGLSAVSFGAPAHDPLTLSHLTNPCFFTDVWIRTGASYPHIKYKNKLIANQHIITIGHNLEWTGDSSGYFGDYNWTNLNQSQILKYRNAWPCLCSKITFRMWKSEVNCRNARHLFDHPLPLKNRFILGGNLFIRFIFKIFWSFFLILWHKSYSDYTTMHTLH